MIEDRRFNFSLKLYVNGYLLFGNDIPIDVKSKVMYRISILNHNLVKYLGNKTNHCKRQGLEFSHKSEMNINFETRLDHMTYKHYIEEPMPLWLKDYSI